MFEPIISTKDQEKNTVLYGIDAWTQYLVDKPLPARASSLKKLNKLITSKKSTVKQLAAVVHKDPVLTLYTVRAAQMKHNEYNSEVKSVLHAVTSLGYDGMTEIAQSVSPMTLNPTNIQQKRYLHAIANSHHASRQLSNWMRAKHLPMIEESQLSALFYSVGFWTLWLHAPLHMQQIQQRIYEESEDPIDVEREILGCSMQMISQRLSAHWQLSELTQQAQDHTTSPSIETLKKLHLRALNDLRLSQEEIRTLNHITQEKSFPIKLANWIALESSRNWYSTQTMKTIDIISDYMGLSKEATLALVHKICAEASREYFAPGILSPASQLLFLPSDIKIHYKMGPKELALNKKSYPIPEIPSIKPFDLASQSYQYTNNAIYELIETNFLSKKVSYTKPTQVLMALLKGLETGLGINRLALLSVSNKNNLIKTIHSIGFTDDALMADFSQPLNTDNLFSNVCQEKSYIIHDKLSQKKLTLLFSSDLYDVITSEEFMIISIFRKSSPIGIIYADMFDELNTEDETISNFQRERIRNLVTASCIALDKI